MYASESQDTQFSKNEQGKWASLLGEMEPIAVHSTLCRSASVVALLDASTVFSSGYFEFFRFESLAATQVSYSEASWAGVLVPIMTAWSPGFRRLFTPSLSILASMT